MKIKRKCSYCGEKFVNAKVISGYSSANELTGVNKHWWNNLVTKIDDPARLANWPEKWKGLMGAK